VIPSADLIRDLALRRPGAPVLSVYVRTDPRDPANTAAVPGWLMELRNCLREVSGATMTLMWASRPVTGAEDDQDLGHH